MTFYPHYLKSALTTLATLLPFFLTSAANALDSTGMGPVSPVSPLGSGTYLLVSGVTQLYCHHESNNLIDLPNPTDNPDVPNQYKQAGWYIKNLVVGNCTSPMFTDTNGVPVACQGNTYPIVHVSLVETDGCNTPLSGTGTPYMVILEPTNGVIGHWYANGYNAWYLCFMQAYALMAGNNSAVGNFANTSIVVSYSVYCAPCPTGISCASRQPNPANYCPPVNGWGGDPGGSPNNGVFPRDPVKGTATGWCNMTGSGGINS